MKIEEILTNFRQWSEVSDGYANPEELLNSCELDEDGNVYSVAKITELTGQTWVSAAQIYLHCRLFRQVHQLGYFVVFRRSKAIKLTILSIFILENHGWTLKYSGV